MSGTPKPPYNKPTIPKSGLDNLTKTRDVSEYIHNNKRQLRELCELMSEAEISELLQAALDAQTLALSVEEVAKTVLGNFRAWQKKQAEVPIAEARQKEKDLVDLLVAARTKYQHLASIYKNPYEEQYEEMIASNPTVVDPYCTIRQFQQLRSVSLNARIPLALLRIVKEKNARDAQVLESWREMEVAL